MMTHTRTLAAIALAASLTLAACGNNEDNNSAPTLTEAEQRAVIEQYAVIVEASYGDAVTGAKGLQTKVDAFLASPDEAGFTAARQAWLDAREPYGQTEVYRFYGGPIDDDESGPEGQINAWPLDEGYIDYVGGETMTGGLINGAEALTEDLLVSANEKDGEKNISTGYHAVEFLLWGQDTSDDGPGARPYTDYLTTGGTAANQERRATYLKLTTALLVKDLESVHAAWKADGAYRKSFTTAAPKDSLQKMLLGMGSLSGAELAGERMEVALTNRDQEDEHSCFSDNTHRDIITNALGIQNVYLGRYGDNDGPGLDDLVEKLDPALNRKMKEQLLASVNAAKAIPVPFDSALKSEAGRAKIDVAIKALRAQTPTIVEVATLLGVTINLEE